MSCEGTGPDRPTPGQSCGPAPGDGPQSLSRLFNEECFCVTVDQARMQGLLAKEVDDAALIAALIEARPHLFSNTPLFLSGAEIEQMLRVVRAIEAVAALPSYRETVLAWGPASASFDPGPVGAFMGYDFHLTDDGPRLIEVNTNAGGAFLNALLLRAQRACCTEVDRALARSGGEQFETAVIQTFRDEWQLQRASGELRRIAIVDDRPEEQYLYPEFLLAQRVLQRHGFEAHVADARELHYSGGQLQLRGEPIDLVYNRLIDFALDDIEHAPLRAAYLAGAVVVTPNPRVHALFADKRNMTVLSDEAMLRSWQLSPEVLAALRGVPRTVLVTAQNAQQLWQGRKKLFFKPASGYGSKAVYRGDKLTRGVWSEIERGGYVAQEFAAPSERRIRIDGGQETRKADVRLYVYAGRILLAAARLYQGQATNFRTPGGGFAPLLAL